MTKLLIIGFDAMDYYLTKKTMKADSFKTFNPILKKQITKEARTGPSWASFYTGLDKEIHGVTDGWGRNTDGSNSFEDIQEHTFWNIINKAGYRTYIDNLPITSEGFPYTSSKEKDIVNWIYDPLKEGEARWRKAIMDMGFEQVILKARTDSLKLIDAEKYSGQDLVFLQFSFLDRIGHTFTFKDKETMETSYGLVYEIVDMLFEIIAPQYLIITSDHGFYKNSTNHNGAISAVLIMNHESHKFFKKNRIIKPFSAFRYLRHEYIRTLLRKPSLAQVLHYMFYFEYVKQIDIFDVILAMFNIDYNKVKNKILKTGTRFQQDEGEAEEIRQRLERLGYL